MQGLNNKLYEYYSIMNKAKEFTGEANLKRQMKERIADHDHFLVLALIEAVGEQAIDKAIEKAKLYYQQAEEYGKGK